VVRHQQTYSSTRVVKIMRTYSAKTGEIGRCWYVVDASDYVLGRLATQVATVLRGKHKPTFTPHVDTGDFVIVVNASQVKLTGNKLDQNTYHRYSGYPGGIHSVGAREVRANDPERMIQQAVKGMLPKNKLSRAIIKKLKVYGGAEHPHVGQKPQPFAEAL
jgi:large subunit ribosomal protein L13